MFPNPSERGQRSARAALRRSSNLIRLFFDLDNKYSYLNGLHMVGTLLALVVVRPPQKVLQVQGEME
jgi:hypothetical protein